MIRPRSIRACWCWVGFVGICLGLLANLSMAADAPGENIALGKAVTFSTPPDYEHCTDAGDSLQLTDGQLTEDYFWTQKGCVGWRRVKYVAVTVDLGRVEPISGVSLRTAAGTAGVDWPAAILVATSDDGASYREVADLVGVTGASDDVRRERRRQHDERRDAAQADDRRDIRQLKRRTGEQAR